MGDSHSIVCGFLTACYHVAIRAVHCASMTIDLAPSPGRLTYTVEEAAEIVGVGRSTAYAAVRAGDIPSVRVGTRLLVPKCALERMLGVSDSERPEATPSARPNSATAGPMRGS